MKTGATIAFGRGEQRCNQADAGQIWSRGEKHTFIICHLQDGGLITSGEWTARHVRRFLSKQEAP